MNDNALTEYVISVTGANPSQVANKLHQALRDLPIHTPLHARTVLRDWEGVSDLRALRLRNKIREVLKEWAGENVPVPTDKSSCLRGVPGVQVTLVSRARL